MKKLILKTLLFTIPFLVLYSITYLFYVKEESPDLLRMGYIPDVDMSSTAISSLKKNEKFELLSKSTKRDFKFLNIGDSFSDRGAIGYNSLLANNFTVLQVDRFIADNQIQTLINMVNGDFFTNYKIDYVILQNVERHLIDNIEKVDLNGKITVHQIDSLIHNHHFNEDNHYDFFSKTTIKFPLNCMKFFYEKNYLSNGLVYNVETNDNTLFDNGSNKLLFFYKDLYRVEKNNVFQNAENLNKILNYISKKLLEKNIHLILLPAPDKYDMYYEYIANKENFIRPIFFSNFKKLEKQYIYIDSKEILSKKIKAQKEIYFFGDTHWSPAGAQIIADEITKVVLTKK